MTYMLEGNVRDSTVIPTMRCAQCNQEVHIRLIGQHRCPQQSSALSLPTGKKGHGSSSNSGNSNSYIRSRTHGKLNARKIVESRAFPTAYKPSLNLLAEDPEAPDDFDISSILPGSANPALNNSNYTYRSISPSSANMSEGSPDHAMTKSDAMDSQVLTHQLPLTPSSHSTSSITSSPLAQSNSRLDDSDAYGTDVHSNYTPPTLTSSRSMSSPRHPEHESTKRAVLQRSQSDVNGCADDVGRIEVSLQLEEARERLLNTLPPRRPSPNSYNNNLNHTRSERGGNASSMSNTYKSTTSLSNDGATFTMDNSGEKQCFNSLSRNNNTNNSGNNSRSLSITGQNKAAFSEHNDGYTLPTSNTDYYPSKQLPSASTFDTPSLTTTTITLSASVSHDNPSSPSATTRPSNNKDTTIRNIATSGSNINSSSSTGLSAQSPSSQNTRRRLPLGSICQNSDKGTTGHKKKGSANLKLPTPVSDSKICISARRPSNHTDDSAKNDTSVAKLEAHLPASPSLLSGPFISPLLPLNTNKPDALGMVATPSTKSTLDALVSLIPSSPTSDSFDTKPRNDHNSTTESIASTLSSFLNTQASNATFSPESEMQTHNLANIDTQGAAAYRTQTNGYNNSSASPAVSSSKSNGKTAKLDLLLGDLMNEMQALNVEMRSESDCDSIMSSTSFRNSPGSPSKDHPLLGYGARKTRLNSNVSTASSSSGNGSALAIGSSCTGCAGRITGSSVVIHVSSKPFHRMCFRCFECNRLLDPGLPSTFYSVPNGKEDGSIQYICNRHNSNEIPSSHAPFQRSNACATCGMKINAMYGPIVKSSDLKSGNSMPTSVQGVMHEGTLYCVKDYKKLSMRCRACGHTCTPKESLHALDSWWHRKCFTCHGCHTKFPDKSFYVFDHKPYCKYDYHKLNGSLCVACEDPIEGPCAQVYEGRFHPHCFVCTHCKEPLRDIYYNLNGKFLCEKHIHQQSFKNANKRRTVFGRI